MPHYCNEIKKIYDKTNGHCYCCGEKIVFTNNRINNSDITWQVEHIHPISQSGNDHFKNLNLTCILCNYKKGSNTMK